jgi:regulator of replication initiation timing
LQAKVREQAKALEAALTERERELAKAERTAAEAVGRADALIVERRELRQRMAKERSA